MRTEMVLGMCMLALAACSSTGESHSASKQDVATLATWLTGSFSSEAQTHGSTKYLDIRLHHARIWPTNSDGAWLYVEQARADALDKPYRQRVYHLHANGDEIVSDVFTLPGDTTRFTGAWKNPSLLRDVAPEQLTPREGCSIHMHRAPNGAFTGSTLGSGCPSDRQGAQFATSEVVITETMLTSWDRGFDEKGKQVWGAIEGPYQFAKQM